MHIYPKSHLLVSPIFVTTPLLKLSLVPRPETWGLYLFLPPWALSFYTPKYLSNVSPLSFTSKLIQAPDYSNSLKVGLFLLLVSLQSVFWNGISKLEFITFSTLPCYKLQMLFLPSNKIQALSWSTLCLPFLARSLSLLYILLSSSNMQLLLCQHFQVPMCQNSDFKRFGLYYPLLSEFSSFSLCSLCFHSTIIFALPYIPIYFT